MGWTYGQMYQFGSMKEFIKGYNYENEKVKSTVLDYAVCKRTTLYVAVERIIKETNERVVTAAIVLFNFNKKEYGYKDMDETMGPYNYDCPIRIINLLTPTTNEFALEWRKGCLEYHNKLKGCVMKEGQIFIKKGTPVQTVTLLHPINKSSWIGVDERGGKYRFSKQWLISHGYSTEEYYFEKSI